MEDQRSALAGSDHLDQIVQGFALSPAVPQLRRTWPYRDTCGHPHKGTVLPLAHTTTHTASDQGMPRRHPKRILDLISKPGPQAQARQDRALSEREPSR